MNYTIKRPIRRLHAASLQQYYNFRAARIIYGGAAEATEQSSSLLSNWLLAENASPLPPTQFSINVSAPPYMGSSPVSPFMAIGGQQGFEILPGRVILNANSRIRIACV